MRNLFTLLAVSLVMAACASSSIIQPGPVSLGQGHVIETQGPWSDITSSQSRFTRTVQVLTRDGPRLNQLILVRGLPAGKSPLRPQDRGQPVPTFRQDLTGREQVELVGETLSDLGYRRVEVAHLRSASFGAARAIRFDLTARTEEGLDMSGLAQVARVGDELYLVIFLAPNEHYFPALKGEIEAMMNLAR